MQVLLVEDDRSSRVITAQLAESLGHKVQSVESAEEAMIVLARGGVDLLFTDMGLPKRSGIELTQWVRSREKDAHLYVLLLTAKDGVQVMEQAFAAGVDDFVTKGASRAELAARFRVAERISRVEQQMRTRAEELESALRRLDISSAMRGKGAVVAAAPPPPAPTRKELLSDLRTWKGIDQRVVAVLAENTHREFAPAPVPTFWSDTAIASRITLTDVEHKVEIEIMLVAEHPAVHAIACKIFGDPELVDEALVADTMLELANGAMGAFKTAFHVEDYRFTAGIPKPIKPQAPETLLAHASDRRILAFVHEDVVMTVLLGVREKHNRKVKVGALKDGMVLAEPILRLGVMLLKAGTRLSEVLIERLHSIDKDLLVELSDPGD